MIIILKSVRRTTQFADARACGLNDHGYMFLFTKNILYSSMSDK